MKKSKNKYSPWPAVALCLVFLALRIVDLALFTDPETSFPTVGPSAARWGTALVGAAKPQSVIGLGLLNLLEWKLYIY